MYVGRDWGDGVYRVLSVIRLALFCGVVLPGTLVIDGCLVNFQNNLRDIPMRADVSEDGREGDLHKVSVRGICI